MGFFANLARQIIEEATKPEQAGSNDKSVIARVSKAEATAQAALSMVRELRKQMSAALAIDYSLKSTGKIIIMTRVNGRDHVRILDTKPDMAFAEYRDLVESLQKEYGASLIWVDGPPGSEVLKEERG